MVASSISRCTRSGTVTAHSSARIPPIDPPSTRRPSVDAERVGQRDLGGHLVAGGQPREPGPPRPSVRGRATTGRSCPGSRPSTLGATTNQRSVSSGAPGPIRPSHQPGVGCPGPARPDDVRVAGERVQHQHGVVAAPATARPRSRTPPAPRQPCRRLDTVGDHSSGPRTRGRANRRSRHRVAGLPGGNQASLAARKPGLQVGQDVVDVLDADGQPDQARRDAGAEPARSASAGSAWSTPGG